MPKKLSISGRRAAQQRGISILITLVALTVLMFSAVALVRSFSASTLMAGSVAFKRSSISVGERGFNRAMFSLLDGVSISDFANDAPSAHYFASIQSSDTRGIPKVLLSDAAFAAAGMDHSKDFSSDQSSNEIITYVIERQCIHSGAGDSTYCVRPIIRNSTSSTGDGGENDKFGTDYHDGSGSGSFLNGSSAARWPMRVTVRIQDSVTKQTTYLQSTVLLQ